MNGIKRKERKKNEVAEKAAKANLEDSSPQKKVLKD